MLILLANNETALLSTDFTVDAFAERMRFALTHPESLKEIGPRAQEIVLRKATLENMTQAIVTAVKTAIHRRTQQ